MTKTRLYAGAVGVLAAATFALTGCGGNTPGTDPTAPTTTGASSASAKDEFTAAINKVKEQSVKAVMKMEGVVQMTSTTLMDMSANKADATLDMDAGGMKMNISIRSVNGEVWMKMGGVPGMPDKWMHAPADKIKEGSTLDIGREDPANFAEGVVAIERDGDKAYKGTIDLTKVSSFPEDTAKQLGDKAKAVPFTATVDGEGRLTSLVLDMNSVMPGAGKMTTTYSDFGAPVNVTPPPAAEVVEMPTEVLESMNTP